MLQNRDGARPGDVTLPHVFGRDERDGLKGGALWVALGGAFVGAMAYTFSDTFWFSAVEGEVYATSSLFTAVVFWAILKWENIADEPGANRWLVLIAYLVGLSTGVHLLNLLAIPAIVLVYYFRKYKVTRNGLLAALALSFAILLFVMYGIIPGVVKLASGFELLFTNGLGLHYQGGLIVYLVLLLGGLAFGIYRTHFVRPSVLWNTVWICLTVIVIGYSSYALILIRASASPPMNENRPDNAFTLLSYLNREQYGDSPLVFGHQYNAQPVDLKDTKAIYELDKEANRYDVVGHDREYIYDDTDNPILLPRMWSMDPNHIEVYQEYGSIKDPANPTFGDNVEFLLRYQIGHMYFRYFLWNFVGKQNDIQGNGGVLEGNWLSGIDFIDALHLGSQKNLPKRLAEHPARNTYFFLPLLLGLLGLFFHLDRSVKDFWVVMSLFILTGLAIVIYLNQTPLQPRERDYAYAGSFYAFAIWIGLGVGAVYRIVAAKIPDKLASLGSVVLCFLAVPSVMAVQNWDDHDRSGRYTARDIARNYLESCEENGVLFTVGDNDTFPLWYVQDVEGVREDVRIVNMMLFNMEWYIDQMRWKNYSSEPLPFTIPQKTYDQKNMGSRIYVRENERKATADYVLTFVKSEDARTKLPMQSGLQTDFIPTHQVIIPVDTAKVLATGTVPPEDASRIVNPMELTLPANNYMFKNALAQLDVIVTSRWERPIYYTAGGFDGSLGLEEYYRTEGLAYRVVLSALPTRASWPWATSTPTSSTTVLMNTFTWGRMNAEDVYLDYYHIRTFSVIRFRSLYIRLAMALLEEGRKDKAGGPDRCMNWLRPASCPSTQYVSGITLPDRQGGVIHYEGLIEAYYKCGEMEKGNALAKEHYLNVAEEYAYYSSLAERHRITIQRDISEARYQMEEIRILLQEFDQENLMAELGLIPGFNLEEGMLEESVPEVGVPEEGVN
ncbi:MAG: DUF2723 domain-containing protein [Bacteroidales bacterium]